MRALRCLQRIRVAWDHNARSEERLRARLEERDQDPESPLRACIRNSRSISSGLFWARTWCRRNIDADARRPTSTPRAASGFPRWQRRAWRSFATCFCDRGAFTVAQARRILAAGRACGLVPRIHAEQFTHTGAARLAIELQAASADHLEKINRSRYPRAAAFERRLHAASGLLLSSGPALIMLPRAN